MTQDGDHRSQRTAQLLEAEISAGLERLRTRIAGTAGTDALLAALAELDERRAELRDRLDAMPDIGGAWGMASDTPLAGLADVVLRLRAVDDALTAEPTPQTVATAERLAAASLPRPVRLLQPQRAVIESLRLGDAPPWSSPAVL